MTLKYPCVNAFPERSDKATKHLLMKYNASNELLAHMQSMSMLQFAQPAGKWLSARAVTPCIQTRDIGDRILSTMDSIHVLGRSLALVMRIILINWVNVIQVIRVTCVRVVMKIIVVHLRTHEVNVPTQV